MSDIVKPLGQNKIWAANGVAVEPSDTKYQLGWTVEKPPYQWVNFYLRKFSTTLAAINQKGYPTWDAETEYRANLSWALGTNGSVYFCKVTHTNQNPVTDLSETYWRKILDGQKVLSASAVSSYMLTVLSQTNSTNALTALGITTVGRNIVTSGSTSAAQDAIGASALGKNIFNATSATIARQYLGATTIGAALFTASSAANARTVLEIPVASDTQAGLVMKATDAEAVTGTNDTKFLTPRKLKLGFSINAVQNNGYIYFPSWLGGIKFQWGVAGVSGNNTTLVANFPTACIFGTVSLNSGGGTGNSDELVAPSATVSGTRLLLANPDGNSNNFNWFAIGI